MFTHMVIKIKVQISNKTCKIDWINVIDNQSNRQPFRQNVKINVVS